MAINKVEANGETLIDLTNDTATANDVLEGQTFHLRSGAPATGTYRPSDEIEAYQEATVGHSSKNLLPITLESGRYEQGGAILDYTVDKAAGTITLNGTSRTSGNILLNIYYDSQGKITGKLYLSGGYSEKARVFCRDYTVDINTPKWDGTTPSGYSTGENDSQELMPTAGHINVYKLQITPNQTFTNAVIKPMIRSGSISDDTFEPYRIPTDELIARLDQRIYELERVNENPPDPDPDEGEYLITVFNNFGSDCDIWLTTPESDGGNFYDKYVSGHWAKNYNRPLNYCGKRITVLFKAGTSNIVMTLNSSQSGQGRFYKQFDVRTFLDMRDVNEDGNATNYISIHLCDDGGIRSQAEYEAYIGS